MKSNGKTKVARKAIVAALSELDALSRDEYGVGLEELILSDSPGASMRLERIVGIVLKRPFATKAPPNPSGLTRARRSWPWADEDPDDQAEPMDTDPTNKPDHHEEPKKPFEKKKKKFQDRNRSDREDGRNPPDRYSDYTPLTRPRTEILAYLTKKGYDIRWPRSMPDSKKSRTSNE